MQVQHLECPQKPRHLGTYLMKFISHAMSDLHKPGQAQNDIPKMIKSWNCVLPLMPFIIDLVGHFLNSQWNYSNSILSSHTSSTLQCDIFF